MTLEQRPEKKNEGPGHRDKQFQLNRITRVKFLKCGYVRHHGHLPN